MNEKEMKEFKKRIQINRERSARVEQENKQKLEAAIRKDERTQLIINAIEILLLIALVIILAIRISKNDSEFIENCVNGGNDLRFCQLATDGQ